MDLTFGSLILVGVWLIFPVCSGLMADSRQRSAVRWSIIGLLFGPVGMVVVFLPVLTESDNSPNFRCEQPHLPTSSG